MTEWEENINWSLMILGMIGLTIFIACIMIATISQAMTMERITVEGDVVDVVAYEDYMEVFMDNGQSYNIRYPGDNIDLTKGSSVIMRLTNSNTFWIDDNIWDKVSITKIPEQR